MKIINILILLFTAILVSNCTPARVVADNYPAKTRTSKVKVNRTDSILFLAVPAIFGYDDNDKTSLSRGEISELNVPLGKHEFFVRSNQADRPFKSTIEVKEHETLCLTIHPEIKPAIKVVIPFIYYFSHAFRLEKSEVCK